MIRRTFAMIFIVLCIYVGGYWWFRLSRTGQSVSSPVPTVSLPGSGPGSSLTRVFRPLICLDGYLSGSLFLLVDAKGEVILGKHPYPFAWVGEDANP